jgi:hypothetical protein
MVLRRDLQVLYDNELTDDGRWRRATGADLVVSVERARPWTAPETWRFRRELAGAERLEDRRGLRLEEDHPVVKQVLKAKWQLTKRGFGPWARIYRKATGAQRQCVQLAVLPWDTLDERSWPGVSDMAPADIARVLGIYAQRVSTPRGSTAVSGLELMTALRPPTRPVRDEETGNWVSGPNPGSLGTEAMDPAPPEGQPEHPAVFHSGWDGGFLHEEAYNWVRPVEPSKMRSARCPTRWAWT